MVLGHHLVAMQQITRGQHHRGGQHVPGVEVGVPSEAGLLVQWQKNVAAIPEVARKARSDTLSTYLPTYLPIYLSIDRSIDVSISISIYLYLYLSLSISIYLYLSLSLSISIYLYVSQSISI